MVKTFKQYINESNRNEFLEVIELMREFYRGMKGRRGWERTTERLKDLIGEFSREKGEGEATAAILDILTDRLPRDDELKEVADQIVEYLEEYNTEE